MKKFIGCLGAALMLIGCSTGKIIVEKDDFKDATVVKMDYKYKSNETTLGMATRNHVSYYREIKNGQKMPAMLSFKVIEDEDSKDLAKEAFIRVNGQNYKLTVTDITSQIKTRISTKTVKEKEENDDFGSSHSSFVDYTGQGIGSSSSSGSTTTTTTTSTSTQSWKELIGKVVIPPEAEQAIMSANSFTIRIYSGSNPLTFVVKEEALQKAKSFFAVNGSAK
jgi:hypothetical protein